MHVSCKGLSKWEVWYLWGWKYSPSKKKMSGLHTQQIYGSNLPGAWWFTFTFTSHAPVFEGDWPVHPAEWTTLGRQIHLHVLIWYSWSSHQSLPVSSVYRTVNASVVGAVIYQCYSFHASNIHLISVCIHGTWTHGVGSLHMAFDCHFK